MQEIYRNKAPKIRSGEIEYCLKVDMNSKLYIEMVSNSEDSKKTLKSGPMLFQECIDIANKEPDTGDNNNSGFYRAILSQLGIHAAEDKK